MKTGIDLVEIDRFKILDTKKFLEKYFTINEMDYISTKKNKYETIAGIFACKEAVLKAFKIGIGVGISLKEIEILHENNIPFVNNNEILIKLMQNEKAKEIDVNISHSENLAIAICIIN